MSVVSFGTHLRRRLVNVDAQVWSGQDFSVWHRLGCRGSDGHPASLLRGRPGRQRHISGNVADPQGQVIPGATLTVISEATNDARVTVSDGNGGFPGHQPSARLVHRQGRDAELPHARTQERRPQRRRAPVGRHADSRHRQPRRNRRRRGAGARRSTSPRRSTAASSPSKQIEQVQVLGRDVTSIMRLLPGVRYENTVDSLGMSFGTVGAERRRRAPRLEQRHRRRRRRERSRRQQPDGAADQPRRDRRGPGAAQLLSRGVRPGRRRPGADRQQERHRRTTTAISTTTAATRRSTRPTSSSTARTRRSRATASTPTAPTWRAGAEARQEAVLLLLARGAARQPPGAAPQLDDADRSRDAGRLLADAR